MKITLNIQYETENLWFGIGINKETKTIFKPVVLYLVNRTSYTNTYAKFLNWIGLECFGNNRDSIVQQFGQVSKTDIREPSYRESIISESSYPHPSITATYSYTKVTKIKRNTSATIIIMIVIIIIRMFLWVRTSATALLFGWMKCEKKKLWNSAKPVSDQI